MGFAAPLWLAALAAIAVPVVIHLRSHRPGRVVRIGSIRHFAATATPHARGWRLRDQLLLALRAAAVAFMALALAGPWLATRPPRRTLVLVAPELPGRATTDSARALLDSLDRSGADLRLLRAGLPSVGRGRDDAASAERDGNANYWSLLAEADRTLAPAAIVVAAPTDARHFRGVRPAVSAPVRWIPSGTPATAEARPARELGDSTAPDASDAATAVPAVYADSAHSFGARYVAAALEAALGTRTDARSRAHAPDAGAPGADAAALGAAARPAGRDAPPIPVRPLAEAARDSSSRWIVWLASVGPPEAVARRTRDGGVLLTGPEQGTGGTPLWRGADGEPLLSAAPFGRGVHVRFAATLDANAASLLLSPAFPDSMRALLDRGTGAPAAEPALPVSQALPDRAPAAARAAPDVRRFASIAWSLALIALGVERLLAIRRTRSAA
jgi:hypothetical protein